LPSKNEPNWSGKGQHVEFSHEENVPLDYITHLGSSASAVVDKVRCKRIFFARKLLRRPRKWTGTEAFNEVEHLSRLRHAHIVQLVGTYVQDRVFAILIYPAAEHDLNDFMDDIFNPHHSTSELESRIKALASFPACLISALAYTHSQNTKHMDIKPANILVKKLSKLADTGSVQCLWRVYLADFGLSRNFTSDNSQTDGPTARTARYCAPEVFLCEARGRAADVFRWAAP
jgi:serine/threonine protein kinase